MSGKSELNGALALITLVLMVPVLFLEAFVALKLWGWFIEPAVHQTLTYGLAIGLSLIGGLWVQTSGSRVPKTEEEQASAIISMLFRPVCFLIIGWLAHAFI
jgi:hypothetical protein